MNNYKKIGIIGGQGPASTIAFYDLIVKYLQDNLGARHVADYPPMIIYSVPTPSLVEGVENEEKTFYLIADAIYGLEREGADFVIITCISLQYFIEKLQPLVKIPIIPITPILAEYAKNRRYKTLGILATEATLEKKVCHTLFEKEKINLIRPKKSDQNEVGEVILDVIGGRITLRDSEIVKKVIGNLQKNGAEAILLACTELPLVLKQSDVYIPLINCNELYPKAVAEYACGRIRL